MHRDPVQMHRFYLEESSFAHGGADNGSEEPVLGQKVSTGGRVGGRTAVPLFYCLFCVCGASPSGVVLVPLVHCVCVGPLQVVLFWFRSFTAYSVCGGPLKVVLFWCVGSR